METFWSTLGFCKRHSRAFAFGRGEGAPYLHWQNLNELPGDRYGSILRHGRAWFHWGNDNNIGWSWNFWSHFCHAYTTVGGIGAEDTLAGGVALPPVAFWWSVELRNPPTWLKRLQERMGYDGREVGVHIHNSTLWVKLWAPEHEWSADQPKWMDWNFNPIDFILGANRYTHQSLETVEVEVPMPEGVYPAKVEVFESTWKRDRWPWPKRMVRTRIKPAKPIPVPGKGENSWDCEDDAIWGQTSPASTPEAAVAALVASAMETRAKHGGPNWQPKGRK